MAKHRARKVIKNVRKFVTWYRRSKIRAQKRWQAFNQKGDRIGKVHCHSCNKWIHKDWMTDHIALHEKKGKPKRKKPGAKPVPQNTWGPWKRVPPNPRLVTSVNPPQKQTPSSNPNKQSPNGNKSPNVPVKKGTPKTGGKPMPTTTAPTTGGDEGTDTPHAGNDEVSGWFGQWASRYPSNFEINHQDAEALGEMWHGVGDSYRRKAAMLVEDNHFPPSIVEPYEQIASLVAQIADLHKEMADRTQSTFATLIEAMQGPVPRDTNFAKPK